MITEDLERLCFLKKEYKGARKKFREDTKPMVDEIHLLEATITEEVLKTGQTICVEGITAEYKPVVEIRLTRKEKTNE